jgi:transcriptional regulator with XRE-family HTH domain
MAPQDLKDWRHKNGYTQDSLSHALGVHLMTVSKWERGIREIPPFLHLALDALEYQKGGERVRDTKKEVQKHGKKS